MSFAVSLTAEAKCVRKCETRELVKKNLPPKKNLESSISLPLQSEAGGRGGLGGIPPALQILGEICSNFFERTPQRKKMKKKFTSSQQPFKPQGFVIGLSSEGRENFVGQTG